MRSLLFLSNFNQNLFLEKFQLNFPVHNSKISVHQQTSCLNMITEEQMERHKALFKIVGRLHVYILKQTRAEL
jgi:hypothetical protein